MYLHLLSETNKTLFMAIAQAICSADGNFSDSERFMLDAYAKEMNLDLDEVDASDDVEAAVDRLAEMASSQEKRIIVLELVGLSLADLDFSEEERVFLQDVVDKFDISKHFVMQCETVIGHYFEIQKEFNQLVASE